MGVCGPGEIVAGIVVFQNQLHGYDYEAANIPFWNMDRKSNKVLQRVHISLPTEKTRAEGTCSFLIMGFLHQSLH